MVRPYDEILDNLKQAILQEKTISVKTHLSIGKIEINFN